jgi:hypothetical protein
MNRQNRWKRLLYHSGLDEVISYAYLPNKTINFAYDILPRVDFAAAKTINSHIIQQWDAVAADVVVKEVWEGNITQQWSQFLALYHFWRNLPGPGDYLLWRPLDLTDKMYRVRIINMQMGGEEFNPTYIGKDARNSHERWAGETVTLSLQIMPAFPPSATIYAAGTLNLGS